MAAPGASAARPAVPSLGRPLGGPAPDGDDRGAARSRASARMSRTFAPAIVCLLTACGYVLRHRPGAGNGHARPTRGTCVHKPGECTRFVAQIGQRASTDSRRPGGVRVIRHCRSARQQLLVDPAEAAVGEDRPPGPPRAARAPSWRDDRRPRGPRSARRCPRAVDRPRTSSASESRCALRHLARQVGGGHDHLVRACEGAREVLLEHARARGVGARLEDRHEPARSRRRRGRSARSVSRTAVGWCAKSS